MLGRSIIIIAGCPATGKTTYGTRISQILKIPFFSKDRIKELIYNFLDNDGLDYESKRRIGEISYKIFYQIIEEQMKAGLPIMAESNFTKESIEIIKNLLNRYSYSSITLKFDADVSILHKRFLEREYSDNRPKGLKANGKFDDFYSFENMYLKSKEFVLDNKEILIDTTDFSKVDIEKIIENILLYLDKDNNKNI